VTVGRICDRLDDPPQSDFHLLVQKYWHNSQMHPQVVRPVDLPALKERCVQMWC
jgi:hypothetical protein